MGEVTGAVIATALVLAAVFVPVAFFPGTTGRLYQQFALTIAVSMAISAFNALTLTPALSALLLERHRQAEGRVLPRRQPRHRRRHQRDGVDAAPADSRARGRRASCSSRCSARPTGSTATVPTGFVPDEDQGYVMVLIQAPPGASLDYTMNIVKQVEQIDDEASAETKTMFAAGGFGFTGTVAEPGHHVRAAEGLQGAARRGSTRRRRIVGQLFGAFSQITGAMVIPFLPPSIQGPRPVRRLHLRAARPERRPDREPRSGGAAADRAGQPDAGADRRSSRSSRRTIRSSSSTSIASRRRASACRSATSPNTMQILLGSAYVNDFDFNNRSYRVYVQADQQFRSNPADIARYQVRTARRADDAAQQRRLGARGDGAEEHHPLQPVPLGEINGSAAPGYSSGPGAADDGAAVGPRAAAGVLVRVVGPVARGDQGGHASRRRSSASACCSST